MPRRGKNKAIKLADALNECHISSPSNETSASAESTVILSNINPTLICKWPKVISKVPDIFLHKPTDIEEHVHKLLSLEIKFYQPLLSAQYTKIKCPTNNDQKALIQYLESQHLPYHTFGHSNKRKLKVVIRGLPKDIDLEVLKKEFKAASIPVIRLHKMTRKESSQNSSLILAVVQHNEGGRKLVRVTKVLGFEVKMEPPQVKTKQCHRCQLWGHSQRYCHGKIKCVKCGGDHFHTKCQRDKTKEPPKCANCGGAHTASYRQCPFCPDSSRHRLTQLQKQARRMFDLPKKPELVTLANFHNLYKNKNYMPFHPFIV